MSGLGEPTDAGFMRPTAETGPTSWASHRTPGLELWQHQQWRFPTAGMDPAPGPSA